MIQMPQWPTNDTARYFAQMKIYTNQLNQDVQNQKVHDNYIGAQQNYNVQAASQLAAGQPLPAMPPLPSKVTYNDDGTFSLAPFPDLTACVPPTPGTPSGGIKQTENLPLDETDAILLLVQQDHQTIQAIAKKLGL